jgi:hypothetical protein
MTEPQTNSGAIEVSAKVGAYLKRIQSAKNPY